MLLVLAFSRFDADNAIRVLTWMHELHGPLQADSVGVCAKDVPKEKQMEVYHALAKVFKKACVSTIAEPYEKNHWDNEDRWPGACNDLFVQTLNHLVRPMGLPALSLPERVMEHDSFYFFEPDCIPVRPDWWQKINEEYEEAKAGGKKILAFVARHRMNGPVPEQFPVGTAVYPRNLLHLSPSLREGTWSPPGEPRSLGTKSVPWDIYARNDLMPMVKESKTIFHRHRSINWCHPCQIPFEAAIVHGGKDDSLMSLAKKMKEEESLKDGFTLFNENLSFVHSGDIGDIIYSLPVLKWFHGHTGSKCDYFLSYNGEAGVRERFNDSKMAFMKPLLESLPYIRSVTKYSGTGASVSFFDFREKRHLHENLSEGQLRHAHAPLELANKPWLSLDVVKSGRVIIARSSRYQNTAFPWRKVIDQYKEKLLFIGTPEEHVSFCRAFKLDMIKLDYRPVTDMLDMAKIIAASDLFIGNQSSPYALAAGLGHPRIQETMLQDQNSLFWAPNAQHYDGAKLNSLQLPDLGVKESDEVSQPGMLSGESPEGALSCGDHPALPLPFETPIGKPLKLSDVALADICAELRLRDFDAVLDGLYRVQIIRVKSPKGKRKRDRAPAFIKTPSGKLVPEQAAAPDYRRSLRKSKS